MDEREVRTQLERHHAESYGWALACCRRDSAEAEAVLHAAYVKVLEGKARFDARASFKTWLFSVIRIKNRLTPDQQAQLLAVRSKLREK